MTIFRYFPAVVLALFAGPALAADANGYTAQYECRAGNSNCNVDVATLTTQACQQIIAPGDAWSTINWSNNVICIAAGDHSAKGTLTLGSSGTSGTYKVLRYYRSSDTDDEPWNQSASNKATVKYINANGQNYWIIHRITVEPRGGTANHAVYLPTGTTNTILSRMLVQNWGATGQSGVYLEGTFAIPSSVNKNTIQNSVVRDGPPSLSYDTSCIQTVNATNTHIVNNELYDCQDNIQNSENQEQSGMIVENNDVYTSPAMYTDCAGNYTPTNPNSPCAASEGKIGYKYVSQDTSIGAKYSIIHNRIWGGRATDTHVCCASGTQGQMVSISIGYPNTTSKTHHVLVQNNIIFDGQHGIQHPRAGSYNNSIIGNILYKIHDYRNLPGSWGLYLSGGIADEVYLNTIVDSDYKWASIGVTNGDWRCNTIIDSGSKDGTLASGEQMDSNVYYGTTDSGETNKISKPLVTRANSTAYSLNQVIRTTATPPANGTAGDFLYLVITAGTSASSAPSYTTTLGGTSTDGTMTVQAIRGPYSFKRKLRTVAGGERYVIPYAMVHASAPEHNSCPNTVGNRNGIGVNDAALW